MVAFRYPKGGPEGSVLLAVILKNNLNFLLSAINLALLSGYWGWVTKYGLENRLQVENMVQQIIRTVWNLTGKQVSPLVGGFSFSQHEIFGKIPISLGFTLLIIWSRLFRIPSFLQGQLQPPPTPSFYFNSSVLRWNLSAFKWTQNEGRLELTYCPLCLHRKHFLLTPWLWEELSQPTSSWFEKRVYHKAQTCLKLNILLPQPCQGQNDKKTLPCPVWLHFNSDNFPPLSPLLLCGHGSWRNYFPEGGTFSEHVRG